MKPQPPLPLKFVVTAGPTREHLDPVRFLSNPSTGRMGFAIAAEAARRGYPVTLVAGPVALKTPRGVRRVDVVSAREMLRAVVDAADGESIVVSVAAVADWRPATMARHKLKKGEMSPVLRLVRNPDILKTLARRRRRERALAGLRLVGFAAETDRVEAQAARKCRAKGLEFIVANDVTKPGCGFATPTNQVTLVFADGRLLPLPLQSKARVARRIVDEIVRA